MEGRTLVCGRVRGRVVRQSACLCYECICVTQLRPSLPCPQCVRVCVLALRCCGDVSASGQARSATIDAMVSQLAPLGKAPCLSSLLCSGVDTGWDRAALGMLHQQQGRATLHAVGDGSGDTVLVRRDPTSASAGSGAGARSQ